MSNNSGKCLICDGKTEIKTVWSYEYLGTKIIDYFDLCEKCKLVPNCFTCLYSKSWYFRYKGKCDKAFGTVEESRPDCKIFKTKKIGNTVDFWNHIICKRYRRGDATKGEFEEANYHD
jgi:hypothetical protein